VAGACVTMVRMQRARRALAAAVLAAVLAPAAHGDAVPLTTRLAQALAVRPLSPAASGAIAVDLASGQVLFARHPDSALAPASNEKLPITFAALQQLGPDYRFPTQVVGRGFLRDGVWHGDLFLKGYGDPTLTSFRLGGLVLQLKRAGIQRVTGRVLGDESWFDAARTAPGWKSSYFILECPPLGALVVDRDRYQGHISVHPALAAAGTLQRLLRQAGVKTGRPSVGVAPAGGQVLAEIGSARLSSILADMDRESDNFTAEMVLKALGADAEGAGTSAAGAAAVVRALQNAGVPLAGVRIADGSGLSLDDRLTVRAIATILVDAWNDPELRPELWRALPVAGMSGTMKDRLDRAPARGAVRAKTGTTDRASALSGYVRDRYVFAVVLNGSPVATWSARKAEDRFATTLASAL
jgi:serine-type D-Ala-D-Ala carboxypeptidase/endopeptidase (penicillin-binding protein 4)